MDAARDVRPGAFGEPLAFIRPRRGDVLVSVPSRLLEGGDAWEDPVDAVPWVGAVVSFGEGANLRGAFAEVRPLERRVVRVA